jgi:ABC-2 type transport system ATP-binding protein
LIEVKNLTKRYGNFVAVDHLNFRVEKGKIYGFLGPNGAGKSTTMNMITGYISASEGTVLMDGYDISLEPEEVKRRIGYLPEIPPVYPDMTPYEYLRFAGQLKGVSKRRLEEETERVMEATEITSMKNRLIKNLSKGYRQRVGFSCALLADPPVIILDEPTVGLDPRQIADMRHLIQSLKGDHTVILSSHILSEVSAVCDHVLIISKGKLAGSDTPENLMRQMQRRNVYDLLVQGDPEIIRTGLEKISSVQQMNLGEHPSGFVSVHLETHEDEDPRSAVFHALAEADCPIMELTSQIVSLEDVFLELTGQEHREGES